MDDFPTYGLRSTTKNGIGEILLNDESKNPVHKPTLWLAASAFMFAFIPIIITIYWPPWQQPQYCSSGLCQQTLTVRTQTFTVPATSMRTPSADCDPGELATGGGFRIVDDPNLHVWQNQPASGDTRWSVGVSNYGPVNRPGEVFAVCIKSE